MSSVIASFVAFVSSPADLAVLRDYASKLGLDPEHIRQGTIADASEYLKTNASPEVLLVEIGSQEQAPAQLDALAQHCDPSTRVIATGTVNEYSFYCWLMDIGLTQYLLSPLSEQALSGAFEKLATNLSAAQKEKPPSKVVAVFGARGGVGATTIAINLAAILAENTQKKVALVDLDPQEGSVSLALDMQPSLGLRDALEKPDRIDSLFLERVMTKLGKYLSVLSAEESLADELAIHSEASSPLIAELRAKYDYVVLDVPRHLNHFTRECLKSADHSILVTELTLLSLRDTLRMQDLMRDAWKAKPPMVVANRIGLAAKQEVPPVDFEKGIGVKIAEKIQFAPDIYMPMTRDIPALKHKSHAAIKPLYELAAAIAPNAMPQQEEAAKSSLTLPFFKKKGG